MPTLLQINISANSGSTGRIAEEIGERAIAAGWRSIIAYGRAARPSKNELLKFGSKASFMMHCVESILFDNHGLGSRLATRTLIRKIEEIKPDVIQLHNIHGYYVSYRLLFDYLNKKNIPVVWTLHDCWSFTGHCSHFLSANCEKWMTGCYDCPKKAYYPQSLIDRSSRNYELKKALFTANSNLTAVPVCQWLADLVKQSFLKNADIEVIKNGVDLNVFAPKPRTNDGMVRVLGVSNVWQEAKGLCDFCDLREMLNPEQFEIILVGLTEEQIKQLPKGIKGITRTSSVEELVNYYSNADVFVNPTYADTFPTTNIEALACGTPVITYNTGGSPEAIDENTGIVVPKGDKEALREAVIEVVTSMDKYGSEVCRKRAVENFNKDDRFGDYIELFNQALKAK
jgi:glycosyltransferase involved in cell wall biosynthesis